ncbi:TPA: hypothetical protein REW11_004621 [Klebsiella pneumoniae]|nr:hypothetical protein [Klebsiella pneumoniae]
MMELSEAKGRIDQAEAVLRVWLEEFTRDDMECCMVAALLTVLDGVSDAVEDAEKKRLQARRVGCEK